MEKSWQGKGCCSGAVCWSGRCRPPPCGWVARQRKSPVSSASSPHAAELRRYCVTCHNGRLRTAGLSLEDLDVANPAASPDAWEKVIQKLRSRTMPPAQAPRPDEATYDSLATWLEGALDRAAAAHPNPAQATAAPDESGGVSQCHPRSARARRRRQCVARRRRDLRVRQHRRCPGHLAAAARKLRHDGAEGQPDGDRQSGDPAGHDDLRDRGGSHAGLSSARSAARHPRRPARRGVLRRRRRVRDPGTAAAHGYSARSGESRTSTSWS